jgi:hypothetical protein
MTHKIFVFLFIAAQLTAVAAQKPSDRKDKKMLKEKIEQFTPVKIKYDHSLLNERQKIVVSKLAEATKIMDEIFQQQVYSGNAGIKQKLESSKDKNDKLALAYFNIMSGPFDRLENNKPFYGNAKKPLGANFYPEDMTKEEFLSWIKAHPEDEKAFTNEYTMIRRKEGKLTAIPFSEYFSTELSKAAKLMREAASYADNASLKKFLTLRADSFESNDYYESDMAWMDLKDHVIEIAIGPYEVYEDEMFNYKASFESFLTIVDPVESAKLARFADYLKDIEENLPIDSQYKNSSRGSESPILVVQEVYSGGDTKAGVQTLAFNLPNDERVRAAKGSKKVMLKNIHEAKFEKLLKPIAELVLDKSDLKYVTFDGFFNHTLMHEVSHGVGPGIITVNGNKTEVKKELKETYSKIEECKADILGIYNNIFMIDKGVYPKGFDKETIVTFIAGIFRSVRFGVEEAHGGSNAIIYNYLLEKGGLVYNAKKKTVSVDFDKIQPAIKSLANKILMIEALGDYEGSQAIIAKYGINSPSMDTLRKKLSHLPVDIAPVFEM